MNESVYEAAGRAGRAISEAVAGIRLPKVNAPEPTPEEPAETSLWQFAIHFPPGGLYCIRCIREGRVKEETENKDWAAMTITGGEALCIRHVLLLLRKEGQERP